MHVFRIYNLYSFKIIPIIGQVVVADRDSYQYLVESIRQFPSQEQFAEMVKNAGFTIVGIDQGVSAAFKSIVSACSSFGSASITL